MKKSSSVNDWPIIRVKNNKDKFISGITESILFDILSKYKDDDELKKMLSDTIRKEQLCVKFNRWPVDNVKQEVLFNNIKERIPSASNKELRQFVKLIAHNYIKGIDFSFNSINYRFIYGLLLRFFSGLLFPFGFFNFFFKNKWRTRLKILGGTTDLCDLSKHHTLVFVPSHSSNLDSLFLGTACFSINIPPLVYGAGLNLFNNKLFSFFMGDMGTYKIDRRRKNFIYLDTLKHYSSAVLQSGCHNLFYPGGGRSKSGRLEKDLKLGLLQTTLEAQIANYRDDGSSAKKIIIVPVVLSYQCVIEAPKLIRSFLHLPYKSTNKFCSRVKSIFNIWKGSSSVVVKFGDPIDVLGNDVDKVGTSYLKDGKEVDLYKSISGLLEDGGLGAKKKEVAQIISDQYYSKQYIFACYVVSFVAFTIIYRKYNALYGDELWHQSDSCCIDYEEFKKSVSVLVEHILNLNKDGMFSLEEVLLNGTVDDIIDEGIKSLGNYHVNKPLLKWNKDLVITQDLCVLYYYHNRLDGYGFEKYV
jgi:glycerol-3-phosphate O-acyltransferase